MAFLHLHWVGAKDYGTYHKSSGIEFSFLYYRISSSIQIAGIMTFLPPGSPGVFWPWRC